MPSRKPTLVLSTPVTASFPAEALMSAASVRTPHSAISTSWRESAALPSAGLPSAGLHSAGLPSAGLPSAGLPSAGLPSAGLHSAGLLSAGLYSPIVAIKTEEGLMKTPLSPPVAYMDFLKLASPSATSPCTSSPVTTTSAAATADTSTHTGSRSNHTRPRMLHRASISGPVKITASNLGSTKPTAGVKSAAAAAAAAAATASSTSLASTSSASNSDTESLGNDAEDKDTLDSGLSTASSNATDCCTCEHSHERAHKSPKIARIDTAIPASAFSPSSIPTSAPPIGRTTFPSLKIPISPAISNTNSPIRSPFSAKSTSITSPFDWESALKARYAEFKAPPAKSHAHALAQAKAPVPAPAAAATATASASASAPGCAKCSNKAVPSSTSTSTTTSMAASASNAAKTSIRHIREVVTRTVTYTPRVDPPRMNAPPKGKKRKIDCDDSA
ncbi:hypothetical protein HMPREF1624_07646 [Sporothrix schenckii ATCC 58251]|uniref:Uncharacterized protein n=1 Tax=Sporothrix schenckii (strain ATCC 58251 / de Perez 2211183) TaxID=1391915 RepID=U7PNP1_SPOS1|nr:hypothetical protein HMPREF1624_07646 [Sporothrix schenckii ATCC 58251]